MITDELVKKVCDELIRQGMLIEAGWRSYQLLVVPADASETQLVECRRAFFAGAQHLFGTMMNMMDPGGEPTTADISKIDAIDRELRRFITDMNRHYRQQGKH